MVFLILIAAVVIVLDFTERIDPTQEVAVLPIYGVIRSGSLLASNDYLETNILEARNQGADAFLFQINSPGGTVVHSKQMKDIVESVEEPTVCLFEDIALSGAYWVASACDHIISDSLSLTGSIGVTSAYLEYSEHLEKEGISYVDLVEGDLKDMGTPYRNITEEEREIFSGQLDTIMHKFLQNVAENRDLEEENLDEIARGKSYLGVEAKDVNLVDALGTKEDAKVYLEDRLDGPIEFKNYGTDISIFDILGLTGEDSNRVGEIYKEILFSTFSQEDLPLAQS